MNYTSPFPELRESHVFTMVRPWVDVGSAVSHHPEPLWSVTSGLKSWERLSRPGNFFDFTRYRPTIRLVEGPSARSPVPNSVINYAQPEGGPDLLFFRLHGTPRLSAKTMLTPSWKSSSTLGIRRYCRLGAMYDAVPHTRPLLVTGDTGGRPHEGEREATSARGRSTYQGPTSYHEPGL